MTTTLTRTATLPAVDLDTRLAITDAGMTLRLEQAMLRFDVDTAHQPEPVAYAAPILPAPAPQSSPLAAVYLAAIRIIRERGWTRGGLRDEQGAVCAVGAIRVAAGPDRGQADDACAHLLEVIQTQFTADTLPAWNDQQTSPEPVIRMLHTAANRT
jgi:hypothetical protein